MIGIEDKVWVQVNSHDKVFPICDEDLERDNADKTSAVHFMRYELDKDMINTRDQQPSNGLIENIQRLSIP